MFASSESTKPPSAATVAIVCRRRGRRGPRLGIAFAALLLAAGLCGLDRLFYESVSLRLNTPSPIDADFYNLTKPVWNLVRFFPHIVGVAAAALLIGVWRPRGVSRAVVAAVTVLAVALAANLLQDIIGRARPNQSVSAWDFFTRGAAAPGWFFREGVGFPSGEAATGFALAFVLWREFPRFGRFFLTLAALVLVSRALFGMHYLSDVMAGALFALAVAPPLRLFLLRLIRRRTRTAPAP